MPRSTPTLRTHPSTVPASGLPAAPASADPSHLAARAGAAPRGAARRGGIGLLLRLVTWLAFGVLGAGLVCALAGGLLYVKLLFDPVPLRFLVDPISLALRNELDGADVRIADAALQRGDGGAVELWLKGLSIAMPAAGAAVEARGAIVDLDMAALWSGRIAASRIVLIGASLAAGRSHGLAAPLSPSIMPGGPAGAAPPPASDGRGVAATEPSGGSDGPAPYRLELARLLAQAMAHLRRGGESAAHLKTFGLRNSALVLAGPGGDRTWSIPEFTVDVEHRQKRSLVWGKGRVAAEGDPFSVEFRLQESEKARLLRLETEVRGMRPVNLARHLPEISLLGGIAAPVGARGAVELTTDGDLIDGRVAIALGRGEVLVRALWNAPVDMEGGEITLLAKDGGRRLELAPSLLQLRGGWIRLKGGFEPVVGEATAGGWLASIEALDGELATGRETPPLPIDRLALSARLDPATGTSELQSFVLLAGGAAIEATASPGGRPGSGGLEGRIGTIKLEALKGLLPLVLAGESRELIERSLVQGRLKSGTFRFAPAASEAPDPARPARAAAAGGSLASVVIEADGLAVALAPELPPLAVPKALITIEGNTLEVSVPDAHLAVSGGRRISLKGVQVTVPGLDRPRPQIEISGKALGSVAAMAEIGAKDGIGVIGPGQVPTGTDGKVEAQLRVVLASLDRAALQDMKLEARVRVTEGRIPNVLGAHDVTGGTFTIGATEKTVDIKGEMLLAGIMAKANGQWIMGEARERQAPILVTARLDGADRRQLGLALDEFVTGEIPIELQFTPGDGERSRIHVSADLGAAELTLDGLAWKKPAGRAARLAFEVVRRQPKGLELQGFKISGEGIAIEGGVVIGADGQPQSYKFPGFSLNVVSNLEVEGIRGADKVWDVKARGKTFDGGQLMRSLYSLDEAHAPRKAAKKSEGVFDLDAQIDTVLGVNDTTVRQVRLKMRRQGDLTTRLELSGLLEGNHAIEAHLKSQPGQPRIVHASTSDAGQALKTIGFYTSMVGGKGELWVNLDGRGAAEREGQVRVTRFRLLGDPVVAELIQGADESRPAIASGSPRPARRIVREEIQFDHLAGSFASGNGQVALESLTAAGPLIGASVRGKMDFRSRTLAVGGTYVPLSGLSRALSGIPLVGELLTGPKGDGIIGITFAVDGPMAKPNVMINPLSLVAPGVLREIFQMAPENPKVTPRADGTLPQAGSSARVRSSAPETVKNGKGGQPAAAPKIIDGWSSKTTPSKGQR